VVFHPLENPAPSVTCQVTSKFTFKRSQAKKYRHAEKKNLKSKISEFARIVQQQRLRRKELEKIFQIQRINRFNCPWLSTISKRIPLVIQQSSIGTTYKSTPT
jgi:hypothetical protein